MPPSGESSSTERRFQSLKPCRLWLQGNCKYGDKCKFSHTNQWAVASLVSSKFHKFHPAQPLYIIQVQKGKNREDQPTVNEDLGNTPKLVLVLISIHRLTKLHLGKSTCRLLFNELYTDGTSNSKAELQIQSSTTAFEAHSSANKLVCRDWKAGTCPRGNKCRYRHGVSHIHSSSLHQYH